MKKDVSTSLTEVAQQMALLALHLNLVCVRVNLKKRLQIIYYLEASDAKL